MKAVWLVIARAPSGVVLATELPNEREAREYAELLRRNNPKSNAVALEVSV